MENAPKYDDGITEEMMLNAIKQMGYSGDMVYWALDLIAREDWPNFISMDLDKRLAEIAREYPDVPPPYDF